MGLNIMVIYGPEYLHWIFFNEIKKQGLLNPVIGQRYVQEVIGKGGSKDPDELLRNFLGREPNNRAFIEDLGL